MKIVWEPIDKELVAGKSPAECAALFNVKQPTIEKHIQRTKLPVPSQALMRNIERRITGVQKEVVVAAVNTWLEKGEKHREKAFEIAHESVKKFKAVKPKNFKELEIADKIARRAAGLDVSDVVQQTLINVNERIENFDDEVIEAEVVPSAASG